jgi:hypothetical protein
VDGALLKRLLVESEVVVPYFGRVHRIDAWRLMNFYPYSTQSRLCLPRNRIFLLCLPSLTKKALHNYHVHGDPTYEHG